MEHSMYIGLARQRLNGMWLMSAVAYLLYSLIMNASLSAFIGIILIGPLEYGLVKYLQKQADEGVSSIETMFSGFNRFAETMVASLLKVIIESIGLALFIIPGIMASLGLSMTFYIMADEPNISGIDALKKSWRMMEGYKMDFLLFNLRFIGWGLLSILTCGLGFLFLVPYFKTAQLYYYRELRNNRRSIYY